MQASPDGHTNLASHCVGPSNPGCRIRMSKTYDRLDSVICCVQRSLASTRFCLCEVCWFRMHRACCGLRVRSVRRNVARSLPFGASGV